MYLPLTEDKHDNYHEIAGVIKGTGRILHLDGEEVMRLIAKAHLEDRGYEVITAENGRQALNHFVENREKTDQIPLDMMMPVMNGRECFNELKKLDPSIKVVVSSVFSREEDMSELRENGLKGFIRKPYLSVALSKAAYAALNKISKHCQVCPQRFTTMRVKVFPVNRKFSQFCYFLLFFD